MSKLRLTLGCWNYDRMPSTYRTGGGRVKRLLTPGEWFAPEALETFKI